jgi:hypothetical protein
MIKQIDGAIETQVFVTEGGFVAIRQPARLDRTDQICLLSADQILPIVRELQALYDNRREWDEVSPE